MNIWIYEYMNIWIYEYMDLTLFEIAFSASAPMCNLAWSYATMHLGPEMGKMSTNSSAPLPQWRAHTTRLSRLARHGLQIDNRPLEDTIGQLGGCCTLPTLLACNQSRGGSPGCTVISNTGKICAAVGGAEYGGGESGKEEILSGEGFRRKKERLLGKIETWRRPHQMRCQTARSWNRSSRCLKRGRASNIGWRKQVKTLTQRTSWHLNRD